MLLTDSAQSARRDPEVRAAMKKQQLARLKLKAQVAAGEVDPEVYSAAHSAQPAQVARAAEAAKIRESRVAAKNAIKQAGLAEATAGEALFAQAGSGGSET